MRITGGLFRGRTLDVPKGLDVRPTQDRVREALFSILMHDVPQAAFLDLFAGSGSVGLEALSRGARRCTFVERDRRHADCLRRNIERIGAAAGALVSADAYAWVAAHRALEAASPDAYDIVFADPPYQTGEDNGYAGLLEQFAQKRMVRPGGLFIAEMTARQKADEHPAWDLCRDRTYGRTRICIWKLKAAAGAAPEADRA